MVSGEQVDGVETIFGWLALGWGAWGSIETKAISDSNKVEVEAVNLHLVSWTGKCPENKLSRVGVAGSSGNKAQIPTKLKLKLLICIRFMDWKYLK